MMEGGARKVSWLSVLVLFFMMAGVSWALNPTPPNQPNVSLGSPITIKGVVKEVDMPARGRLQIDTSSGVVTVYGIGPRWYWLRNEVPYPTVGENIVVKGFEVKFSNGEKRIIARKITVSGQPIVLRDFDGMPLWRRGPRDFDGRSLWQRGPRDFDGRPLCGWGPHPWRQWR